VSLAPAANTAATVPARRSTLRAGVDPLLASCLWGGMYVVSRASFGAIPPVTLAALRVVVGGLTLWVALRIAARRALAGSGDTGAAATWTRGDHLRGFWCGVVVAACIVTQFLGTDLASAHDGALLTTVTPVFVVPLAWVLLGERPQWRIVAGMLVALAGVAVVVGTQAPGGSGSGASIVGDALLLFSAFAWALFTVLGAPLSRKFSALAASTTATLWSVLFLAPLAAVELALRPKGASAIALTPGSVAAVLYLAWGATALAWLLWYRGVAKLAANVAAVFFFAQPVVGGILSSVFLHEALPAGFWLGGLVLAAGILVVSWQPRKRQAAAT